MLLFMVFIITKFLHAEGCQKRSGCACILFHVHKSKHLQRVFKCVTERQ